MNFLSKNNEEKLANIFDIDKIVRRAAHAITNKVSLKHDINKVFVFKGNCYFWENKNDYYIAVVHNGPPNDSLLSPLSGPLQN